MHNLIASAARIIVSRPILSSVLNTVAYPPVIMPFYHAVSDTDRPHFKHLFSARRPDRFEADLDFFLKYYTPIAIDDLDCWMNEAKELPKSAFFVSFDDGLSEAYEYAAPILKRKGITATFFLISAFIDNKELFYRHKASLLINAFNKFSDQNVKRKIQETLTGLGKSAAARPKQAILSLKHQDNAAFDALAKLLNVDFAEYLQTRKPYLSSDQVRRLMADGFSIGAHSIDHPIFRDISLDEQLRQAKESLAFVNHTFGDTHRAFAFPFHAVDVKREFFEKLRPHASFTFGTAGFGLDKDRRHFNRIALEPAALPARLVMNIRLLKQIAKRQPFVH
jgi:peptidoglycan/xylan/chitin deacetylase (PgdA/CDA1 family)